MQHSNGRRSAIDGRTTRHAGYGDFSLGRETFLAPVTWNDGWPTLNPQDIYHLTVNEPTLPLHPWPTPPAREDFDETKLGLDWMQIGVPRSGEPIYSLTERPGFLRLHGTVKDFSAGSAFVCRRQTEWKAEATTRLEFKPLLNGDEAGLAVYMGDHFHYEIGETMRDGKRVIILNKSVGDMQTSVVSEPISAKGVWLKINSDAKTYTFSYAVEEGQWKKLGTGQAKLISSEVADVWSGACFGLYAHDGDLARGNVVPPADFDWFEYHAYPETFKEEF